MKRIRFIDRMAQGKIARRDMMRAAAAFGVGVASVPVHVKAADQITVFEWTGYDIPELMPGYAEKYGGPPEFAIFASEEEAFQKIRTGFQCDVVHPCTYSVYMFKDAGMTTPVDTSKLSHWPDVIPFLQTAAGVVIDGGVHMVPTDWGNSSVIYRTDMVDEAFQKDESWGILFDEAYEGKIAPSDGESNVEIAGLLIGLSRDEIFHMTDEQLEQVRPLLDKQARIARFYWTDPTEFGQAMASGEVVAAYAWNDAVKSLTEQGLPVKYAVPKEGIFTWLCGLTALNTGEGDPAMVHDFIDAWLAPEAGKFLIESYGYGHSNTKAFQIAAPEAIAALGFSTDPSAMLADGILFQPLPGELNDKYINLFNDVKANAAI
ncbi:MAG: ABC transporter substrate-binding protein [Alphaproteobacteria bacterium]